jgi:hypothetical protein
MVITTAAVAGTAAVNFLRDAPLASAFHECGQQGERGL